MALDKALLQLIDFSTGKTGQKNKNQKKNHKRSTGKKVRMLVETESL
jgi:hypothetical protein